jgi:hypothetical protein
MKNVIFHDVEQNSDEWLELRKGKATASSFGAFMANLGKPFGDPAKRYALQLALERVTGNKAEHGFSNAHMERGHAQEPIARLLYEETFFTDVGNGGFFDCGRYGDSPDGLIGTDGVLEIKSVIPSTHYETLKRGSYDPSYKWQLIGHLDCTGRDYVDFVSYCSDFTENKQLLSYRILRTDVLLEIEQLNNRREEFLIMVDKIIEEIL